MPYFGKAVLRILFPERIKSGLRKGRILTVQTIILRSNKESNNISWLIPTVGLDFDYLCYGLAQTENALTLTEKGERSGVVGNMNILRIAGRDGSFEERVLTDEQLATVKAFLKLLPDACDDL